VTSASPIGLVGLVLVTGLTACRLAPPPDPGPSDARTDRPGEEESRQADDAGTASVVPTAENDFEISDRAAAIVDSIEAAVRDSFAQLRAEEAAALVRADSLRVAARADSIAAAQALQDSLIAVARQDSIAAAEVAAAAALAAARRDSIAEAARQDSIATARQDSVTAVARRDSLAAVARADSIAAAEIAAAAAASTAAVTAAATTEIREDPEARATEDLETLRALGPSYIPYDQGPETIWSTETQATLSKMLLPVLRAQSLPATTRSIFWVLISREGVPVETEIQTPSGNGAFDAAAREFLEGLTFLPAMRSDRPVASWVLREISILMQ